MDANHERLFGLVRLLSRNPERHFRLMADIRAELHWLVRFLLITAEETERIQAKLDALNTIHQEEVKRRHETVRRMHEEAVEADKQARRRAKRARRDYLKELKKDSVLANFHGFSILKREAEFDSDESHPFMMRIRGVHPSFQERFYDELNASRRYVDETWGGL